MAETREADKVRREVKREREDLIMVDSAREGREWGREGWRAKARTRPVRS